MGEPRKKEQEEVSVTMVGDLASALQIASHQRRSYGDENCEVSGLVQEAVSDWLHKEIYGPSPVTEPAPIVALNPEAPDRELAQPVEAGAPARSRWWVLMIVLCITLLGVIGWSLVRITQRGTEGSAALPVAAEPVATDPVPAGPAATGFLMIDAQPWAEVDRVWDESGVEVVLPDDRYTPLRLELPAQRYSVRLVRPGSTLAQTCQAQVTDSATTTCMPHQTELDATGLFKETGWWK